jgi:hypothetical protein
VSWVPDSGKIGLPKFNDYVGFWLTSAIFWHQPNFGLFCWNIFGGSGRPENRFGLPINKLQYLTAVNFHEREVHLPQLISFGEIVRVTRNSKNKFEEM